MRKYTGARWWTIVTAMATLTVSGHDALAQATSKPAKRFAVTSSDVRAGASFAAKQEFTGMGCKGNNVSPQLSWTGAPAGTKSFAVTIYDPDAPTGSGWWHWMIYNIPATTTSLPAGSGDASGKQLPKGAVQGPTDFGIKAYGGPCPPAGDKAHHYIITVFALKVPSIDVPATASSANVGYYLHANALATAKMVALYKR